jgi:hypothetical protein
MLGAASIASHRRPLGSSRTTAHVVAISLLAGIFLASPNFRWQSGPHASPFAGDFLQEWIGGHIVRHGDYARFYDVAYAQQLEHDQQLVGYRWDATRYFPMVYPPFYYLLLAPLSCLPFSIAALLWAALLVLAYVTAWRIFRASNLIARSEQVIWLFPLSLLFMPLIESLTSCQKGSVLLLILTATYFLLATKRPYWAGVVFGLIAFKPQFALPMAVAMLCKREWRFVLGGLTSGGLLALLCLPLGLDVCHQYVEFSLHATDYLHNSGYDLTKSHAWYGFFALLNGGEATALVRALTLVANLATVALAGWTLRGPLQFGSERFARQFSVLIVATVLLSPHLYTYDLTVLLLPLGLLATQCLDASTAFPGGEVVATCCGRHAPRDESISSIAVSTCATAYLTRSVRATIKLSHVQLPASLKWSGLGLFCLAGISPTLASMTGVQLTVPLMLVFLLANKKAADMAVGGGRVFRGAGIPACRS